MSSVEQGIEVIEVMDVEGGLNFNIFWNIYISKKEHFSQVYLLICQNCDWSTQTETKDFTREKVEITYIGNNIFISHIIIKKESRIQVGGK